MVKLELSVVAPGGHHSDEVVLGPLGDVVPHVVEGRAAIVENLVQSLQVGESTNITMGTGASEASEETKH